MKNNHLKFEEVSDFELLSKTIFYLFNLRFELPHGYLYDSCSGAIALLIVLRKYFNSIKSINHGDNKK